VVGLLPVVNTGGPSPANAQHHPMRPTVRSSPELSEDIGTLQSAAGYVEVLSGEGFARSLRFHLIGRAPMRATVHCAFPAV
jgi:hypothetical protein